MSQWGHGVEWGSLRLSSIVNTWFTVGGDVWEVQVELACWKKYVTMVRVGVWCSVTFHFRFDLLLPTSVKDAISWHPAAAVTINPYTSRNINQNKFFSSLCFFLSSVLDIVRKASDIEWAACCWLSHHIPTPSPSYRWSLPTITDNC